MKTNLITGEAELTDIEIAQESITDDNLYSIRGIISDVSLIMMKIQRLKDSETLKAPQVSLSHFQAEVNDSLADLLNYDWERLMKGYHCINHPINLPDIQGVRK